MMNLKILYGTLVGLLFLVAAPQLANARAMELIEADQNSLSGAVAAATSGTASTSSRMTRQNFVKITAPPPTQITHVRGTTLELECEVMGSPTPYVQWVHGSGQTVNWDDMNVNIVSESSPTTIARVVSRLVLDHPSRAAESTYTCIGRSGGQIALASSTVYRVDGSPRAANATDAIYKPAAVRHLYFHLKPARITLHYKTLFEFIGATVILPCKTIGRPMPEVVWKNEEGNAIDSMQDARFRTLPTGELVINDLRWADMGTYTCVAKNALSKDETETFLYPTRPN